MVCCSSVSKGRVEGRNFESTSYYPEATPAITHFGLQFGDAVSHLEITEATDPADQREMTAFERSGKSMMLLGEFGGRFSVGASQPGRAWASDVIDAINRKRGKAIFEKGDAGRHLVIYPNSNASSLVNDAEDEQTAFGFLGELIEANRSGFVEATSGCLVHVLGKELVGFDVLGEARPMYMFEHCASNAIRTRRRP